LTLSKTPIQKTQIATILGEGSEFEGKLVFEGTVQVEGKFIGQVQSQGTFIIGEKALVRAEIQAGIVLVRGEVHGTITAGSRIEAYAPAKIFGDLSSPVLVFGEGILFQGTSHMIPMEEGKEDPKPFSTGPTEIGP
jgi:cytoskeletal protein CcmA (bactofilin family)